ncbi:hypothetical protein A8924_6240 [Saccharopolyspora erythraea NRRL 2338]|uniref:Uncharacterized protein n=2 Tax=Saccharopolyspora erythraea TaxID=1836 RepID=A4FM05_SACEN|nr:hypothetical protein [Saccharopolyspora erythraea]EQD88268.1 hypothetical protein N599_00550 [Saccharopolyspora erythraea D]PFG98718.1 hypothetical protein A8924_6240 [Saccharopolyspora erythraea NRRL 2338]QRK88728.1 hypothetical protein JQX30_29535 [Saccharopolyspora erythraea]CAM05080.1 hypothetical protein SACE_5897 [Saccharopolyspora erythraea NRRL 2338]
MGLEVTEENRTDGARIVESVDSLVKDFDMSVATLGNVASVGLDALGFIANPLGMLSGAGVGWLIEHVSFLKEPLDDLAGDPDAVNEVAAVWGEQVAMTCGKVASEYARAAQSETASWEGRSADSYRRTAAELAEDIGALEKLANGVRYATQAIGVAVASVRAVIRDMIADVVGEIIAAFVTASAAAFFTAGASMAAFTGWAVGRGAATAGKIIRRVKDLLEKIADVMGKFDKLKDAARSVRVKAHRVGELASKPGAAVGSRQQHVRAMDGRFDSFNNAIRDRVPSQLRDRADGVDNATGARVRDGWADTINGAALRRSAMSEATKETAAAGNNYDDAAEDLEKEEKK